MLDDTISAVATAAGEGGIGIIRMSGPDSVAVAGLLFHGVTGRRAASMKPFQAAYGTIADPQTGEVIDEVLLLVMKAPRSYTREDVVEIHCHGGMMPLSRILALTLANGCRLAEPGEFTKRAFLNGRLDLSQAEAVIDVIRAKTDVSLKMAVSHLGGALSTSIRQMRLDLLGLIAHLEANIDFPEEDIDEMGIVQTSEGVDRIAKAVDKLLATASAGRILRDGLRTVIVGKPNVGKSSLLNALVRDERAIVTDIPGTTRDTIEEYVSVRGIPLQLVDTAGIRPTDDLVERIGVERAKAMTAQADLILVMLDRSSQINEEDREVLSLLADRQSIVLVNKSDLSAVWNLSALADHVQNHPVLEISVREGDGLDRLEDEIAKLVYSGRAEIGEGAFIANVRHADVLREVRHHLIDAQNTINAGMPPDCIVIDLRSAWEKLGKLTGDTVGEDILDEIFSRFCIGK